jgi:hypothetical protein
VGCCTGGYRSDGDRPDADEAGDLILADAGMGRYGALGSPDGDMVGLVGLAPRS